MEQARMSSPAEQLIAQGVQACREQDLPRGRALIREAIALQPQNWRYHIVLSAMEEDACLWQDAIRSLEEAARLKPDEISTWFALGELNLKLGQTLEARRAFESLLRLKPDNLAVQEKIWQLNRREVKAWHFSMLNDLPRNNAYEQAIAAVVKDKIVLEIGAGSGLLSMMAARAGAKHVYTCEMVPMIAEKAKEIIAANGFASKVTVIPRLSFDVDIAPDGLPEQADVLITETFDPNLIGENVLDIVADAKARLLKSDAAIVPARASLVCALIESVELEEQAQVAVVNGFDVSAFNEFKVQPGIVVTAQNYAYTALTVPEKIVEYDFAQDSLKKQSAQITLPVVKSGTCHGILSWIRLDMGDGSVYESSPFGRGEKPKLHWLHALHIWDTPRILNAGQQVILHARPASKQFVFSLK